MNVEMLRKIKEHILEEPLRVNMNSWVWSKEGIAFEVELGSHQALPPCGTVACIAGWEHVLGGHQLKGKYEEPGYYSMDRLLLPNDYLFHPQHWPDDLSRRLEAEKSGTLAYAQVVADAIESYIATEGWAKPEGGSDASA